jgi:hypothetical protein
MSKIEDLRENLKEATECWESGAWADRDPVDPTMAAEWELKAARFDLLVALLKSGVAPEEALKEAGCE